MLCFCTFQIDERWTPSEPNLVCTLIYRVSMCPSPPKCAEHLEDTKYVKVFPIIDFAEHLGDLMRGWEGRDVEDRHGENAFSKR